MKIERTNLECVADAVYTIDSGDWQMIVLALALTSKLRPGWELATRLVADKLQAEKLFEQFRMYNDHIPPDPNLPHPPESKK